MKQRPFKQVDVFTATAYRGNPLAVVLDGDGLSTEEMQRFTDWTNLSEATFLCFHPRTPRPTTGYASSAPGVSFPLPATPRWAAATPGCRPAANQSANRVQECGAGLVRLRRDGDRLAFAAPPLRMSGPLPEDDVALIARGLGVERSDILDHAWCDNGPNWRGVMLGSAARVLALQPNSTVLAGLQVGVAGPRQAGDECAFEVRAFFPGSNGLIEDPVTGSLNAALAQWLIGAGMAPERYIASQGTALGRAGRVHVQRDAAGQVWVGGNSVTCVDGTVTL